MLLISRHHCARILFGLVLIGGGIAGHALAREELHELPRDLALVSAGLLAGLGLLVVLLGRAVVSIDGKAKELVTRSRLISLGWRTKRRSLQGYDTVEIHRHTSRTPQGQSHSSFSIQIQGGGQPLVLDSVLEHDEARRMATRVALLLGVTFKHGEEVRPAVALRSPPLQPEEPLSSPPESPRCKVVRLEGGFEITTPAPGFGKEHRTFLKYGLAFALTLLPFACASLMTEDSRIVALALGSWACLVAVLLLLVYAHAFVWRDVLLATPTGLRFRRRLPFPRRTFFVAANDLVELELSERSVRILGGLPLYPGPNLFVHSSSRTIPFGKSCDETELEWIRRAVLTTVTSPPAETEAQTASESDDRPPLLLRLFPLALVVAVAAASWQVSADPHISTLIERYRAPAERRLAALEDIAGSLTEIRELAEDRITLDDSAPDPGPSVFVLHAEDLFALSGAVVEQEDPSEAASPVAVELRFAHADWLRNAASLVRTGRLPNGNQAIRSRRVERELKTLCSLHHVLIVRTLEFTEPSPFLLYKGRYRGEALLFDVDARRLLGGIRFDSGPQESGQMTRSAAFGALHSGLGKALPGVAWNDNGFASR